MKPVDHVTPALPSKWVRRTDDRDRKRDPRKDRQQNTDPVGDWMKKIFSF